MDHNFQEWQNLWQKQPTKSIDTKALISFLQKNTRKARVERIAMIISFILTTGVLIYFMTEDYSNWKTYLGLGMIILAMAMIATLALKRKIPVFSKEDQLSNRSFLAANIQHLENQKQITSTYMWWYAGLLITGLTIAQYDIIRMWKFAEWVSWGIQLSLAAFLLLLFYTTIKKRERQNLEELDVHLSVLKNLEQQLEE